MQRATSAVATSHRTFSYRALISLATRSDLIYNKILNIAIILVHSRELVIMNLFKLSQKLLCHVFPAVNGPRQIISWITYEETKGIKISYTYSIFVGERLTT